MKPNIKNYKCNDGGPLAPIAIAASVGLSTSSPSSAQADTLRAFRFYPCRSVFQISVRPGNSMRVILAVSLLVLALCTRTTAQVLSLDSVLSLIEERNPMLQEYESKAQAASAYASGATSWMAPMVGAGRFMTPYSYDRSLHENEKGSWMFSVEQEIPNPAKLNANRRYLSSKAAVENENRAIQLSNLRAEAKALYYKWLVAEEKLKVLNESEGIVNLMLQIAQLRYPYNQGSLGDIYKTEGRLAEVQNMIEMVSGDIAESSFRLKGLMNLPVENQIMIDTATEVSYQPDPTIYDTAMLTQKRSDIRLIDKTIEVMRLNQRAQRQQAKPDFKIKFDHMQPIGDMPKQYTAMAMVSIPIAPWSSKMYRSEIKGMAYEIEAMKKSRDAILNETTGMLAGMTAQLTRMRKQLNNYQEKIIPALKKNHQTIMLAYEENKDQLPSVIDAWEAMNMAQLEHLEKKEEFYNMIVNYERTLEK
ncbi:MAG TPA: TolC family protein [Chryseosolibacter sp.]|nr:TolC family protein [Chryseosolibacter sp.]